MIGRRGRESVSGAVLQARCLGRRGRGTAGLARATPRYPAARGLVATLDPLVPTWKSSGAMSLSAASASGAMATHTLSSLSSSLPCVVIRGAEARLDQCDRGELGHGRVPAARHSCTALQLKGTSQHGPVNTEPVNQRVPSPCHSPLRLRPQNHPTPHPPPCPNPPPPHSTQPQSPPTTTPQNPSPPLTHPTPHPLTCYPR